MCLQNQFSRRTDVLLLDKEEKLVQAIKTYFSIKNMNISVATKISTAFLELKKKLPDCLVIDIAMPNNLGLEFIQKIKENKKFQHIPFILLTTKGLTEDRIKGYNLGCSAYITKPFDPEELESIIKSIISKNDKFFEFILNTYILLKQNRFQLSIKYSEYLDFSLYPQLTKQEQYILQKILIGTEVHEIALILKISRRNVEKYCSRILDKTNLSSIQQLKIFGCFFV